MMAYPDTDSLSTNLDTIVAILESSKLWPGLDAAQLASLAANMDLLTLQHGDPIAAEGETTGYLYILVDGSADMYKRVDPKDPSNNETVKLITLRPGQYYGETPLLEGTPLTASLIAASSPTRALRLSHTAFKDLLASNPVISTSLLRGLSAELRSFRRVLARTISSSTSGGKTEAAAVAGDADGSSSRSSTSSLLAAALSANHPAATASSAPVAATAAATAASTKVIRMAVYDFMKHEKQSFESAVATFTQSTPEFASGRFALEIQYFEVKLDPSTVVLSAGCQVVCIFVNDSANAEVLTLLANQGVKLLTLRCAGFDNVDLKVAHALDIAVTRVPAYSPYAVAEHAAALALSLNRKIVPATARVRQGNFALAGLVGFDFFGKTVGVIGTGKIGQCFIKIMLGFGCKVLCYDAYPSKDVASWDGCEYVDLDTLFAKSRLISLHCPLLPETKHLINKESLAKMQKGVVLINTSRGGLIETQSLIAALKSSHVSAAGLDVYENEKSMFFEDHSGSIMEDDAFVRLLSFPNVIVTGHQAFLTEEALEKIANVTLENVRQVCVEERERGKLENRVAPM